MHKNKIEDLNATYSGRLISKNTIYNLLGYGIPIFFALGLFPPLIKGLGEERFGILNLVWIVLGYVSFFDFGIGKSLTKIIAEKIGSNQIEQIPGIFWTSLFLMVAISFLASFILLFLVPSLVKEIFNISKSLQPETLTIFYTLAISIPIVSTTAGLRGVLEAYQKFGIINIMRIFLGIFSFLGPLIVLLLTDSLFWIVCFLIFIRIIMWILYLLQCFRVNGNIKSAFKFDYTFVKPVLKLSSWITIGNIIAPLILYSDRFLIGILVSAVAITYYATPYEVITKLLLIASALSGVLFPVFSASYINNPDFSKKIFIRGVKFIFLILYPIILLVLTFSFEGLEFWLGEKFAVNSSLVLQLLTIGIFLNSLAYIPFNFFQGIGKPNIPAIVNLLELPFYLLTMWIAIKNWGINGAAFVWLLRIIFDTAILFFISHKIFNIKFNLNYYWFLFITSGAIIPLFLYEMNSKILFASLFIIIFCVISWKNHISIDEKNFILSRIRWKGK